MITRALLRSIRNDLPMSFTFRKLGNKAPYFKTVDGRFRFQCPHCGETLAAVNPRNNLAHCFCCNRNINNIDLLMEVGYDFREAVELLQHWLALYNKENDRHKLFSLSPKTTAKSAADPSAFAEGAGLIGQILQQEFGNQGPARP